jgi:mono/diheme cytochrome c family protein
MRFITIVLITSAIWAGSVSAADLKAGAAAYDTSCKSCHGANGTANPAISKMMKVDISDLKSAEVVSMSDADMSKIITGGKGKMRPVAAVSNASAENVVAYVRSLKN